MSAIIFIISALLQLALFIVMARLLLQWARADFRNPLCQAVVRITNPVILPLRRILPPIGKIDTASVVALFLVACIEVAIMLVLHGSTLPEPFVWLRMVVLVVTRLLLSTYFWAIVIYAVLSLISPDGYSPFQSVLTSVCEPVLRPFRRLIPPIAGLDFSPVWAGILIRALLYLLPDTMPLGGSVV